MEDHIRKFISTLVSLALLQLSLHSVAFAEADTSSMDGIDLLAEATFGSLYLNCTDHPNSDTHCASYDMFKAACANYAKDKLGIAGKIEGMSSNGDQGGSGEGDQYASIEDFAKLSKEVSALLKDESGSLDNAAEGFGAAYAEAQKELEDRTQRLKKAKEAVQNDQMLIAAALAALIASILFMQNYAIACMTAAKTLETYVSFDSACCPGVMPAKVKALTGGNICASVGTTVEAWSIPIMVLIGTLVAALVTVMAGGPVDGAFEIAGGLIKISDIDKSENNLSSIMNFFITDSLSAAFAMAYFVGNVSVGRSVAYIPDGCSACASAASTGGGLAVCCGTRVGEASTAGAAFTLKAETPFYISVAALVASVAAVVLLIKKLIDDLKELKKARYHTHLECTGGGGGASLDVNKLIPGYANNRLEILTHFEKIKASKSDLEAFNRLRELERVVKGNSISRGPSERELGFFEVAIAQKISFKERGVIIGAKLLELIFIKDAKATSATSYGLKGGAGSYFSSQLSAVGPNQVASWPEPGSRVDYLAGVLGLATSAASLGVVSARMAAKEFGEAEELRRKAEENLKINKKSMVDGSEKVGAVAYDEDSGGGSIKAGKDSCKRTNTCTKLNSAAASILPPGNRRKASDALLLSYKFKQNGNTIAYDRVMASLKHLNKSIKNVSPTTEERINSILKKSGQSPIDFKKGKNVALSTMLKNREAAIQLSKNEDWAQLPHSKFNKMALSKIGSSLFGDKFVSSYKESSPVYTTDAASRIQEASDTVSNHDSWKRSSDFGSSSAERAELYGRGRNIFYIITMRYFKTAYPRFKIQK